MDIEMELDDDAMAFATIFAGANGLPLGAAISELIRRAQQGCEAPSSN